MLGAFGPVSNAAVDVFDFPWPPALTAVVLLSPSSVDLFVLAPSIALELISPSAELMIIAPSVDLEVIE